MNPAACIAKPYWLIIVSAMSLPLPMPGTDPNAIAPMNVPVYANATVSSDCTCEIARLWFKRNLHREGVCLEQ